MVTVHFLDVGQGNMVVVIFPDDYILAYDCNITDENEGSVFAYLQKIMPKRTIDVFVNSHRDADHMRGIKKLYVQYPIGIICDSDVSANTGTEEYKQYMDLRRRIGFQAAVVNMQLKEKPYVKILNGKRDGLSDPNSQSIVLHINYNGSSVLLAGDTDVNSWCDYIMPENKQTISSLVLFASHHGSYEFFNDDPEKFKDYIKHVEAINPAITVISVSSTNPYGHPDTRAIKNYRQYSYGTVEEKMKIFRTDLHGNLKLELHGNGEGRILWGQ